MAYLSGSTGSVNPGGSVLAVTGWDMTIESGEIDVTNTGSTGNQFIADGVHVANGSFSGFWDGADAVTNFNSNVLRPGAAAYALDLELDVGGSNKDFSFSATTTRIPITSEVKSGIKWSVEFRSQGLITFPTDG